MHAYRGCADNGTGITANSISQRITLLSHRSHPMKAVLIHCQFVRSLLVCLVALLAACSRPGSEKVLTIAVNAGVEGSALKTAAHEWGELRNTRIEVVELPYANLFEKELLDLQSRTGAYDVIMLDDPWFPKLAADGGLAPLPREPDADFLASCLAVCRYPDRSGNFF